MSNYRTILHQLTQTLLQPEDHYGEITQAITDLKRLFLDITGLNLDSLKHREDIHLPGGKAIGPVWAALCIQEFFRTKRFLRGVYLGIKSALAQFSDRPIHILYAGTGPFATLAIPLTTIFTPADVKFTFLEVNPESIGYLAKIIAAFQAEEYVQEIIRCDATMYQVDPKYPIQMVISETMQNALQKEPQVAITLNLAPQLALDGILIPQNIRIDAALLNAKKDRERITGTGAVTDCYQVLKTIFELNKNTQACSGPSATDHESLTFPEVAVEVPPDLAVQYPQMALFTTIQVFEGEQLNPWDCSLTLPQMIMRLDSVQNLVSRLAFQYRINECPRFDWRLL